MVPGSGLLRLWIQVPQPPEAWRLMTWLWALRHCVPAGCGLNDINPHMNKGQHLLVLWQKGSCPECPLRPFLCLLTLWRVPTENTTLWFCLLGGGRGIESDSPNILEEFSKTCLQRLALNCLGHGLFMNLLTSYSSRKPLKWATRCTVPVRNTSDSHVCHSDE